MTGIELVAQACAARELVFAHGTGGARGSYIRLEGDDAYPLGQLVGSYRDMATFLAYENFVIVCDGGIANGGGVIIRRQDDEYWVPFALVRGHPHATDAEIDALPDWARAAYGWLEDGRRVRQIVQGAA